MCIVHAFVGSNSAVCMCVCMCAIHILHELVCYGVVWSVAWQLKFKKPIRNYTSGLSDHL